MLLKRLACSCPRLTGILFSRLHKISNLHIREITTRHHTLVVASTLAFTTYSIFRYRTLCEERKEMSEAEQADAMYAASKFKELYEYTSQFKDSEDPELLWRAVRAHRDRANMAEVGKDEKKQLIFEAKNISERALKFGDHVGACHKWYGIMLSNTADYLGTKTKIESSPAMKTHFEKALELNPNDATAHHLMGVWCFSFADLAWYERKIAAVVFGEPPSSTYEEALGHFENAEKVTPSNYSGNLHYLGLTYLRLGNKPKAKEWFQKMTEFNAKTDEDREFIKKAKDHLKSL